MATGKPFAKMWKLICILICCSTVYGQRRQAEVLTPPYFNLAYQRSVEATATCGVGNVGEERYCKLTGADPTFGNIGGDVIQGQLCDVCVSKDLAAQLGSRYPQQRQYYRNRIHSPEHAVDGTEKWWQSPPLSRGLQYNQINFTIDLGQVFHVAYVFIKMANSPRPGVWALERSNDFGETFTPWQYFADNINDCYQFFGEEGDFSRTIEQDDSVICSTRFSSVVPLENGEIAVSLVNGRPSANNFSYSPTLQEWTKATNVRLRLLQTKTLLGHLMALRVDQDPTVTRRYFYSIKDISIGGRCVCNGHADVCLRDNFDPSLDGERRRLVCSCQHNTCGDQCERCCPGFVQKPWRPATPYSTNECEPCQCYGHTTECVYDSEVARLRQSIDIYGNYEGGGVCQNCRHNTAGTNCEQCVKGYYHPPGVPLDSPDTCQPCSCDLVFSTGECDATGGCRCRPQYAGEQCDRCAYGYMNWPACEPCECNLNGTLGALCEARGGQCPCKPEFSGQFCDRCAWSHWGYPNCQRCRCSGVGVLDGSCDTQTGQCVCKNNYAGTSCDQCAPGYFNFPACNLCECDRDHTTGEICDVYTGRCQCRENYSGSRCDRCEVGYYGYPYCVDCNCQTPGSLATSCDSISGQCSCQRNFAGQYCDKCAPGYYRYPECTACNCDVYGSLGTSCDQQTGKCDCRPTFMGQRCSECRPNYYNYPNCEECNCNPEGAQPVPGYPLGGCGSVNNGVLCECKENVEGRICDRCKTGYWDLDRNNPLGCRDCGCHRPGTTGGQNQCDTDNGQCVCKTFADDRRCDMCAKGTYNLQEYNQHACEDCGCDVGGAVDYSCDQQSGRCTCRPLIGGEKCDRPISTHYFPTLHQHKYELEDGYTVRGGPVRYNYEESIFPNYSWRGFAVLSRVQDTVLLDIDIARENLFKIVYHYVNRNQATVEGEIRITSSVGGTEPQSDTVYFAATRGSTAYTTVTRPVYLTSGRWTVSLKSPKTLFLDYMALIPRDYYEASVLQQPTYHVCTLPHDGRLCQHYVYVDVQSHPLARGAEGTVRRGNSQEQTQLFPNANINSELGVADMAHLNDQQTDLSLSIPVGGAGKYYLVLLYYSDVSMRMQTLDVTTSGGRGDRGRLHLGACPYSSLCRQVVVDENGDAKAFDFDSAYAAITLSGQIDMDVAVESVVAVPAREWHIEYIQPRFKCMSRNGECQESNYQSATGTVKTEFEEGRNADLVADDIPPNIIDTTVRVIKLNGQLPLVNVKASVDRPGRYVFVVHYFQPYDLGFDVHVEILTGRTSRSGSFRANYCPSVSGCRAAVSFDEDSLNGETLDLRDLNPVLTFNNTAARPVWLDYIMVVPEPQFSDAVLQLRPEDKSQQFLQQCATDNFHIRPDTRGFCHDSVFSLTADYNNGALQCLCNTEGSQGFSCEQFGGQCPCKDNVIGRDCSRCRTGHYRFPDCLPCNCPSGLCDEQSGQCMCPPHVTGDNCDQCEPRTFGFDPLIGCEQCDCDPQGVRRGNLECDVDDGQCDCKREVIGRRCDQCRNGYYGFPRCDQCTCDVSGSKPAICDKITAQCLCKENVVGAQCQQCAPGTFYLEARNPAGCTSCFCFGITNSCTQSTLRREQLSAMRGWAITNVDRPNTFVTDDGRVDVSIDASMVQDPDRPHYWVAPGDYLDNKLAAYGGKLTYTVMYRGSGDSTNHADVRLEGDGMTLVAYAYDQPSEGRETQITVDLLETSFEHEGGEYAKREDLMKVLAKLRSMHLRASYQRVTSRAMLVNVVMGVASERGLGELASNVEQCFCPRGYAGSSCERCDEGFYRSKDGGAYLGSCIPCNCNGHSETCDPETGMCNNCRDNFAGPQCYSCRRGYHYDEYTRTCQICACPLSIESNNFASSCEVSRAGEMLRCLCDEGYEEPLCRVCSAGFWGNPLVPGGQCRPCDCSGNIDTSDRLSCDMNTGECLRCLNNAAGARCELCEQWYYGDAVDLKNCQECNCNRIGSESCDNRNGVCLCKPNVVGPTCNRCDYGTFGYNSGTGCQQCVCASAVYNDQCDEDTGQCQCKPGVAGRRCDQCERGYYGYTSEGCRACECTSEGAVTCDPVSGRCECLPGVTGAKCDQCLPRWVLIPEQGCEECDNCIHTLLDDVDAMRREVSDMADQLQDVSVGQDAIRRLNAINESVTVLRPRVDDLENVPTDPAMLQPIKDDLQDLIQLSDTVRDDGHRLAREAGVVQTDARDVRSDAEALSDLTNMAIDAADEAVKYAEAVLEDILNNIENANVEQLLRQAEDILEDIKNRDFNQYENRAQDELRDAKDLLRRAQNLHRDAIRQAEEAMTSAEAVSGMRDQLRDLMNSSRHTLDNAQAADDINERTRRTIDEINIAAQDAEQKEARARALLDEARALLSDAEAAFGDVEREGSQLDNAKQNLQDFVDDLSGENDMLRPLVQEAMDHALGLRDQADSLDTAFADARNSAEGALNASNAYRNIVKAIDEAYNASLAAKKAGEEARDSSGGLAEEARQSLIRSNDLREDASDQRSYIEFQVRTNLEREISLCDAVEDVNQETRDKLARLNNGLNMLPDGDYTQQAQAALDKAMDAQMRAEQARDRIRNVTNLERARELADLIEQTNQDVVDSQEKVEEVKRLVPDISALLTSLEERRTRISGMQAQVDADLAALREKISISRGEANMIKVGVTFAQDTVLQVRNPKNLMDAGGYTKISLYFRTEQSNGLLAYIGADADSPFMDYVALEVVNDQVVFKLDLGDGETPLINPKIVSDGVWHEVIGERVGKTAKLTVRTAEEPDSVVDVTANSVKSVLDLDPQTVKFYIGGVPVSAGLQSRLGSTRFSGCVEEVKFDGVPVGLWNFVYGENNGNGCTLRDVLPAPKPEGYRFGGDGYIQLNRGVFKPLRGSRVEFDFRTYAENGLMLLMGEEDTFGDYFAVEMRDGHVVFQYDLGSGFAILESNTAYNDGKWHHVTANRVQTSGLLKVDGQTGPAEMVSSLKYNDGTEHHVFANREGKGGLLKVDGQTVATGSSRGQQTSLNVSQYVYMGGYAGQHQFRGVTNTPFDGCLKNLMLGSNGVDMSDNEVNLNVVPGCIDQARIISFSSSVANSYISMAPVSIDNQFQMTLKVRSTEPEGLIFYASDDTVQQENAFSVVMKDGKISLVVKPEEGRPSVLTSQTKYNDGGWHYITVNKDSRAFSLEIDDEEMHSSRYEGGRRRIATTTPLFFGGVRPGYNVIIDNTNGVDTSFTGCIGDVTINSRFVNFAESNLTDRLGVALSTCGVSSNTSTIIIYPSAPPIVIEERPGDQCALTLRPENPPLDPIYAGTRFGSDPNSRWEYDAMPNTFQDSSDFQLEFKTRAENGLLFFASESTDFITLYMQGGSVVYSFNCGSGRANLSTTNTYNDDRWHTAEFSRVSRSGSLTIDNQENVVGEANGASSALNVEPPFYVGGIGGEGLNATVDRVPTGLTTFDGCIRDPQLNGQEFGSPDRELQTQPCTGFMELGTFFRVTAGPAYLTLMDEFKVGLDLEISLSVKPRTTSGVLLSVHSPVSEEYLVIQMLDGDVIFNVNNDVTQPELVAVHERITSTNLCDGQWHTIKAEKFKNVVRLHVDGYPADTGFGEPGVSTTDTQDPLYIGGVPSRHAGIRTRDDYVGCIKDLFIEGKPYSLASGTPTGNVMLNQCPTN